MTSLTATSTEGLRRPDGLVRKLGSSTRPGLHLHGVIAMVDEVQVDAADHDAELVEGVEFDSCARAAADP